MAESWAASIRRAWQGLQLGAAAGAGNRIALEGVAVAPAPDGAIELRVAALELAALRLAGEPAPAAGPASPPSAWKLDPLASAEGALRAEIVDAHLVFDAQVSVPVQQGQVDFNDATVEHVGPDSRMGVSRLGVYVDAPNGRSYLYQFASAPMDGVAYERRGAFAGRWGSDRGRLRLQPFAESLLRQPPGGWALGLTAQSRQLFERTALSGHLQLGDGALGLPGLQAVLQGREAHCNLLRVHSEAVGRGMTVEIESLRLADVVIGSGDAQVHCEQLAGAITLRLSASEGRLRIEAELKAARATGLRFRLAAP